MTSTSNREIFKTTDDSKPRARLPRRRLWTRVGTTLFLLVAGFSCGGGQRTNPYQGAQTKQAECCASLTDDRGRAECNERIVRVDNEAAANTDFNRATYRCIDQHFVCDGMTGTATQESAQASLDCIQDLTN